MSNERAKLLTPEAKEMYSALYCLNLEVVPSIAEDVKAKVLAAVYAERQASRVATLQELIDYFTNSLTTINDKRDGGLARKVVTELITALENRKQITK